MNFLSHYHFAKHYKSSYVHFGSVLPDLIGRQNKKINIKNILPQIDDDVEEVSQIKTGVANHLEVDGLFHSSSFFKTNTELIKQKLLEFDLIKSDVKTYFIAHIFLELLLDRQLIKENQSTCNDFYESLDQIDESKIVIFFAFSKEKYLYNHENFCYFFNRFKKARYLFHYLDDEQIVFAMNKIYSRVSHEPYDKNDLEKFTTFISAIEIQIKDNFRKVFNEINDHLSIDQEL